MKYVWLFTIIVLPIALFWASRAPLGSEFGLRDETVPKQPKRPLSNNELNKLAKKALRQFEDRPWAWNICGASNTFFRAWKKHYLQIRDLAKQFKTETGNKADVTDGEYLFRARPCNVEDNREVRILFLKWLVERTR